MEDRIEAFCDGIFAIAITLLILEIKVPPLDSIHSNADLWQALTKEWPSWFAFLLSFTSMLVAWVNHHHAFKQLDKISSPFLYANGFLMLTIVVYPFATSLLAQYINTDYDKFPIFIYCFVNFVHAIAWLIFFQSCLSPFNLTRNEIGFIRIKNTRRALIYASCFNGLLCVLAFWFPIVAVTIITMAWGVWLYLGVTVSAID